MTQFHVSPVCSPTRASLMTGRYNYRTGVVDTYLRRSLMHAEEVTLAEVLGRAGYRTRIFGKWHLGDTYPLRSIDRGFQQSLVHRGGGIGQPADPPGNTCFDLILQHNGKPQKRRGYCTDVFFAAASEFIKTYRSEPFLAYVSTNEPDDPLEIDDFYVAPFSAMGLDEATAKAYGMVANIKQNVGRLAYGLKRLSLERDTILIFLTDNGPQTRRYDAGIRGLKGTVQEGGICVPCFIRWPRRLQAERRVHQVTAHIDIFPTLLQACRIDTPVSLFLDGNSLMPLLFGHATDWPEWTLYFQWPRGDEPELYRNCAALNRCCKLVNGGELYDVRVDPEEKNDVARRHPEIVANMRKGYEEWFRDVSSTRGYAPPRIRLGTEFENPVILTRQDWRGPLAGSRTRWDFGKSRSPTREVTR